MRLLNVKDLLFRVEEQCKQDQQRTVFKTTKNRKYYPTLLTVNAHGRQKRKKKID